MAYFDASVLGQEHARHAVLLASEVMGGLFLLLLVVIGVVIPAGHVRGEVMMAQALDEREARALLAVVRLRERGHHRLATRLEHQLGDPEERADLAADLVASGAGGCPELAQRLRVAYGLT